MKRINKRRWISRRWRIEVTETPEGRWAAVIYRGPVRRWESEAAYATPALAISDARAQVRYSLRRLRRAA